MSEFSTRQDDVEAQYQELKIWARENYTHEELIHMFAKARIEANLYKAEVDCFEALQAKLAPLVLERERLRSEQEKSVTLNYEKVAIQAVNQGLNMGAKLMADRVKIRAQEQGKKAAEIRHGKPGGSRSKTDEMRRLWAGGKYSSRDICAEQECGALGLSFSTARRALRGTLDPT